MCLGHPSGIGLDKICLAKFEQNGQPKERSNSASKMGCQKSKMGCQFCQKKNGQRMSFKFLDQCFQTGSVSPAFFCCSRESLFNSTALYRSAAVIFGGLPGTLCYVAIQPCSLDSLIFDCTLITVCKQGIFGKQNG